eukprot:4494449-Prymnesium_polylepis.1
MRSCAAVAPTRQKRSIFCLPMRLDTLTAIGQHTICIAEKHDVATPTIGADAPMLRMCSGSVDMAIPSPSSCVKTAAVIGSTSFGSGASASSGVASVAAALTRPTRCRRSGTAGVAACATSRGALCTGSSAPAAACSSVSQTSRAHRMASRQ